MESSPDTSDWQKRYAVIEKAYCQGRWATVVEAGTLLLRELIAAGGGAEAMALCHRMQLLMAHTLLHGYGDRDAAEDLYEVVRQSDAEPALRQIAEDGLDQCHEPLVSTMVTEAEDDEEPPARPTLFLPETERAESEEKSRPGSSGKGSSAKALQVPLHPLPSMAPEPEPMEETLPDTTATKRAGLTDRGIAADPFNLAEDEAAPTKAKSKEPVMPWLSQPASLEPEVPTANDLPWLQGKKPSALIPDVVDEPELIEVHQASPRLAEEVDVVVIPPLSASQRKPALEPSEPEEEDGELRSGLLLVVVG
ncbi:MAG: hypothetical protein ACK40D_00785 [Cyanobacteriota bacterium]|jgi:hypothetical protein